MPATILLLANSIALLLKPLEAAPSSSNLLANVPLRFEPAGAAGSRFVARGRGYFLEAGPLQNTLGLIDPTSKAASYIRTTFRGARKSARIRPGGILSSRSNYFLGNSTADWKDNVENYSKISIDALYPGIDLVFYGSSGNLEYDFVVHASGDPRAIQFDISGADRLRVDPAGNLVLSAGSRDVRWKAPVVYQQAGSARNPIRGGFKLKGNRVQFEIGPYDRARDLVIDPALDYLSYVGGSGNEAAKSIATDSAGNVYIAGLTISADLPVTAGSLQTSFAGRAIADFSGDAFVAKFTSAGALVYMTYLGGKADDLAFGIAVDSAGNAYVAGMTNSTDFPVTNGVLQSRFAGSGGNSCERAGDAFVAKLNPSGSKLVYSTYLGGSADDLAFAIAVDPGGNAYITGFTLSQDFPTTQGAYQTAAHGGGGEPPKPYCSGAPWLDTGDAFVSKLNPTGSQLVFSTFLGGNLDDFGLAIALDSSQNVYVGGFTLSQNFPLTPGALQKSFGGTEVQNIFWNTGDGFVAKLNSSGTALSYSTLIGGSGDDMVVGIAPAPDGTVWITGATSSTNFPVTQGAIQSLYAGYSALPRLVEQLLGDAFVSHLDASGSKLLYSTYLGGSQNDMGTAVQVDSSGIVYVVGFSDSPDFPVTANALQPHRAGDGGEAPYLQFGDAFVAVIDPAKPKLIYSTYLGGNADDQFWGMVLDGSGGLWATGNTASTNLAVTPNAFQKRYGGQVLTSAWKGDALLAHFTGLNSTGPALGALQNSASSAAGVVSAGMIFTAYGSSMGPATLAGAALDASGKLASSVAGVTVTFDGNPAPLVYVSDKQLAGVAPYEIAGKTSTQVVVTYNGQSSAPLTVPVAATAPGLYSANFTGSGPAVAFNQDNSQNSATNPAAAGSIVVLFGTGEGATNPPGVDGTVAMPGALPAPQAACTVTVGGVPATVAYCGAVPFVVEGEFQLNIQLSPNTPSGAQPVVVTVGSAKSHANLTIFVR